MRSPISRLSPRMSVFVVACALVGPLLTLSGHDELVKAGGVLMLSVLGYMIFGLGIEDCDCARGSDGATKGRAGGGSRTEPSSGNSE